MIVVTQPRERQSGWLIMHELGHSLGLRSGTYAGIDSERYSESAYPSTMNYNVYSYEYSDGDAGPNDFDDWGYLEENLHTPSVRGIKRVE